MNTKERINMWSFFTSFLMILKVFPEFDIEKPHWFWNYILFVPFLFVFCIFIFTSEKQKQHACG